MAQENDAALVSIEDTVSFCQKHSDDFKDIPGFSENIHDLDGLAKQLHTIKQALEESTREYTEQKDVSLSVAISTTVTNTEIGLA